MKRIAPLLFFFPLLTSLIAQAKITLPPLIGNGMVLQQQSKVSLWGWANKSSFITITTSWNKKVYRIKADTSGAWRIKVETPAAGGPYRIVMSDGTPLTLNDVLIGEVWLCSGQSNMEMPVDGFRNQPVLYSSDLLLDAGNPSIRMIRFERAASMSPLYSSVSTGWQFDNAEAVRKFSAVGYQFAKILQQQLKVPVGIIGTYWGGTMVEAWMSEKSLQPFPDIRIPADTVGKGKHTPTSLFNAMVNPLVGYGIKGVLWYQGEQNRSNPHLYDQLLAAMVNDWRDRWQVGAFPFYYVQIAPFRYKDTIGPAAPLREAQHRALQRISNTGMVVSIDAGEEGNIHPADKTTISKRLALWALAKTYGRKGLSYESPVFSSMKVTGSTATIVFKNAPNGLTTFGEPIVNFEIAGDDNVFYPAEARIVSEGIRLSNEKVKTPVAARYGYKDWLKGEVYNTEGFPLAPFRTDN